MCFFQRSQGLPPLPSATQAPTEAPANSGSNVKKGRGGAMSKPNDEQLKAVACQVSVLSSAIKHTRAASFGLDCSYGKV